jgi:hypothetical protein
LLLQDAKQFGLQRQGQIADFVQKKSAFVGHFKAADSLRNGASESASLMAKKLAFKKIGGNGGAVQANESAAAPRTEIVDGTRDQFLAGACFSLDEDAGVGGRNALDIFQHRPQLSALPYDLLEFAIATVSVD